MKIERRLWIFTLDRWLKESKQACSECGGNEMKRIVDQSTILIGCTNCGCYDIEEELPPPSSKSATGPNHWDGVIDNIERLLEDRVSKRGWG